MDLFNYNNFTGIHAIEAYWNQGNMITSIFLAIFFIFLFLFALLMFSLIVYLFYLDHIKVNNSKSERKNNHENQSNSRHPEDRKDR